MSDPSPRSNTGARLPRSFYVRDARSVARDLLGCVVVTCIDGVITSGRIIETEAYLGADDPASHSHRGPTVRNRSMFAEGGHAYVYLIYGMHYCFNVVTSGQGVGEAVLVRSIEPVDGIERMRERRHPAPEGHLADGPARLAVALGIGPEVDGADLVSDRRIWIELGDRVPDELVAATARIGITKAAGLPYRFVTKSVTERVRRGGPPRRGK